MASGVHGVSTQNPSIQSQGALGQGLPVSKTDGELKFQPGTGGLRNRMVGLGDAQQAKALLAEFGQMDAEMEQASYDAPYYRRNESFSWEEGGIVVFNRDQAFSRELKEAVKQREGGSGREAELRGELLNQLDDLHEVNAKLSGQESADELERSDFSLDEFFRAGRALSEHSRGGSAEWLLRKSEMDLADAKLKLAELEVMIQDTGLPDEERALKQTKLEQLKSDIAKWESRLKELNARLELKGSAPSVATDQPPVAVGAGDQRKTALGWAERAKQAFVSFFAPVTNSLAVLGRFFVELPGRLWAGIAGTKEKMGGPVLDQFLASYLNQPPGPKELAEDRMPASEVGDARYICHGMKKDLNRTDFLIGGAPMARHGAEEFDAIEKSLQDSAGALLAECQGNQALCMKVSHFAFQNIFGFQTHAVNQGVLVPDGFAPKIVLAEEPVEKSISIARLPGGSIHMLFEANNAGLNWIVDAEGNQVSLDPSASVLKTRFSFVIKPDLSVAPYPLNPGADDQSAVAYEFRVNPMTET